MIVPLVLSIDVIGASNLRYGHVRTVTGFAEEAILDKPFEHHLARCDIDLPQTAGLIECQLQAGHLGVFAPNTRDEAIKALCIIFTLQTLLTSDQYGFHSSRSARNQCSDSWLASLAHSLNS
jgi:hypothetical protein